MENNYTPLDLDKLNSSFKKKSGNGLDMIFLIIAIISAAVLAALLFILIQKKQSEQNIIVPKKMMVSPTPKPKAISPTVIIAPSATSVPPTLIPPSQVGEQGTSPATFKK